MGMVLFEGGEQCQFSLGGLGEVSEPVPQVGPG